MTDHPDDTVDSPDVDSPDVDSTAADSAAGTTPATAVTDLAAPPDEAADAAVRALLEGLPSPTMPDAVWQRLRAALADEQAARVAAADPEPVRVTAAMPAAAAAVPAPGAPEAPAGPGSADQSPTGDPGSSVEPGSRVTRLAEARRRRTRVLGGLVAASVVVVAATVGLSVIRGGTPPAPVAADAAAVPEVGGAAAATPALRIMQSGISYTQDEFGEQVRSLLSRDEVDDAVPMALRAELSGAPVTDLAGGAEEMGGPVGTGGFTATWEGLRGCVSGLVTATQVGQAIVVDRATWEGRDAGVVVLAADQSPTTVDVWVVEPGCERADPKVLFFFRTAVTG